MINLAKNFLKSNWFKMFSLALVLLIIAGVGLYIILSVVTVRIKIRGNVDTQTDVKGVVDTETNVKSLFK